MAEVAGFAAMHSGHWRSHTFAPGVVMCYANRPVGDTSPVQTETALISSRGGILTSHLYLQRISYPQPNDSDFLWHATTCLAVCGIPVDFYARETLPILSSQCRTYRAPYLFKGKRPGGSGQGCVQGQDSRVGLTRRDGWCFVVVQSRFLSTLQRERTASPREEANGNTHAPTSRDLLESRLIGQPTHISHGLRSHLRDNDR